MADVAWDLNTVDESERDVKVVFVPANVSEPIRELVLHQKAGDAIACMLNFCKEHFSKKKLKGEQHDAFRGMIQSHNKNQAVPDDLFNIMSQTTTVDVIVLQPNRPDTNWVSINCYVDDKGVAKELELNPRASSICSTVGLPQQVIGDCFIASQFDNNEGFHRIDFGIDQLSNDAWIKTAAHMNRTARSAGNANKLEKFIKGGGDKTSTSDKPKPKQVAPQQRHAAEKAKESGNSFFAQQKFSEAIQEYTRALELLGLDKVDSPARSDGTMLHNLLAGALLSNRSASHLRLGDFHRALEDATACVALCPSWPKGLGRQAEALLKLGRYQAALEPIRIGTALLKGASSKDFDDMLRVALQHAAPPQH